MLSVESHENIGIAALEQFLEERFLWYEALEAEPVIGFQYLVEGMNLVMSVSLTGNQLFVMWAEDYLPGLFGESFLGLSAVQGIVYLHPCDGKEAVAAEMSVAKHLLAEVAELDIEAQMAVELFSDSIEHEPEELLSVCSFGIPSLAVGTSLREHVGRYPCTTAAKHGQQMGYDVALRVLHDGHIWLKTVGVLNHGKEPRAVKEIAFAQLRQFAAAGD